MRHLSKGQEASLVALIETLLPPLPVPPDAARDNAVSSYQALQRFFAHNLSTDTAYLEAVKVAILEKMSVNDRRELLLLLGALSTLIGTNLLFVGGTEFLLFASFPNLKLAQRTRLLQGWQHSFLIPQRRAFQGLKRLFSALAFSYTTCSSENDEKATNPFWEAMGYPGPPSQWQLDVVDQSRVNEAMQRQKGVQKALRESHDILNKSDGDATIMNCDVVVVGSGSGGSVAALVLAQAGFKVIVVEKGSYRSPEDINGLEADAMDRQYEQHGILQTQDGVFLILAGAGIGGGTSINWSCCLPLPDSVRQEWSNEYGLTAMMTNEYENSLKAVSDMMGAADLSKVMDNTMNQRVQQGCDALHYEWQKTGQNLQDTSDVAAGYIGLGDRYGAKNGGVQTYLEKAAALGVIILENCHVDQVLTEELSLKNHSVHAVSKKKRATGVLCTLNSSQSLTIHARKSVILAAGALRTPCILQKNFRNPHIGKHLRLHPATGFLGYTPPGENIDAIFGAPMTTVCDQFAQGPDNNAYGVKIECPVSYPGLMASALNWISPDVCRKRMLQYRRAMPLVLVQRDSGNGGSVCASRDGSLKINYAPNPRDMRSLMKGLQGSAQILWAAGAVEVGTGHIRDKGFLKDERRSLDEYLHSIEQRGIKNHEIGLFSAHQMGTCRMTSNPSTGAADPNGELWECDDLFIFDASIFPTASGSNPMLTVAALSHMLSKRLCLLLHLRAESCGEATLSSLSEDELRLATKLSDKRHKLRSVKLKGSTIPSDLCTCLKNAGVVLIPVILAIGLVTARKILHD